MPRKFRKIEDILSDYGQLYGPKINEATSLHDKTEELDCAWGCEVVVLGEKELKELKEGKIMRVGISSEFAVFVLIK